MKDKTISKWKIIPKVSDGFSAIDPVNREYCYLAADGKVYFSDVNISQTEPQNVFVIYKN